MSKRGLVMLAIFALVFSVGGCGADKSPSSPHTVQMVPIETTITVQGDVTSATTADDWTYFSFKTGAVVDASQKNTKDWDLRILGTKFSTNSGTTAEETDSGGDGGALIVEESDLTKVTEVPETGYTVDVVAAIATMADPKPRVSIMPLLTKEDSDDPNYDENKWYTGRGSSLNADASKCYIIRCGNGHYARMQLTNYTKSGDERTYTMSCNYTERSDRTFVE